MKKTLITILTLIGFITFGQENQLDRKNIDESNSIKPTELENLYVRALNNRLDLLLQSGWNYVELNEYGKRIADLDVSNRYKFLTNEELIDLSISEKKTIRVLRLVHKIIAPDTIDINFGVVHVTAKRKIHFYHGLKFKKANFALECGGTKGYQPDIRFAFDSNKNEWKIIYNRFIKTTE